MQNAFIIVSEFTHSKGTKAAGVIVLSALSSLASISVFADDNRCGNGTVTDSCIINFGDSASNIKVLENGTLQVNGSTTDTVLTGKKKPTGSGSSFDDGSKYDSAIEWVNTGGYATGTTIYAGGIQNVVGGTAAHSAVNYHGVLGVYSGGSVTDSTVGSDNAVEGLRADEAYISISGIGSSADKTTINNGGVLSASEGAIVTDTTINAGGRLELSVNDNIGNDDLRNTVVTTAEGVIINKDGILALDNGTEATNVTVNNGGIIWAENGSSLKNVNIFGGETKVQNATLIGNNVFNQQGTLTVSGDVSAEMIALNHANIMFENETISSKSSSRIAAEFNTASLTVDKLIGEGENNNITMRIDAVSGKHDTLKVTQSVDGHFNIHLESNGKEINKAALDSSLIVAKGSNADTFTGDTDIGAYNYSLYQDSDNWKLQRSGNLSASSRNAMMLANVTPTIWASELSVLRNRLGELHSNSDQNGVWLRYITARNRINNNQISYKQDMNGFVLGGDRLIDVTEGKLFLGSQFSYSYSSLDATGSDGRVKSYSVGMYATWLYDNGYYIDGVLKGNRFFTDNNASFNQGKSNASDATNGFGFSIEVGKHINIDTYLIEPYIQLAGFQGQKTDYTFDNGLHVNANSTHSLNAEIGTTLGKKYALSNGGTASPYIRLAASQEFVKNNDVTINNTERFTNDMSGLTGKYGVGANANIVKDLDIYGEFNYAKGNKLETPYSGTVGVRYNF